MHHPHRRFISLLLSEQLSPEQLLPGKLSPEQLLSKKWLPKQFLPALLFTVWLLLLLTGCGNSSPGVADNSEANSSESNNSDAISGDVIAPGNEGTVKPIVAPDTYIKLALPDIAGTTEKVSIGSDGVAGDGNSISSAISADGRYVVFDSIASTLTTNDGNSTWDIFLRDRQQATTRRISLAVDGTDANDTSLEPVISADGSIIAFTSSASNLVASDVNGSSDVFIYNVTNHTIQRVSTDSSGNEADGDSRMADISQNGRFVVFESTAANLVAGDNNQVSDVFLRDMVSNNVQRVSLGNLGEEAVGASYEPAVSDDGRFIIFASDADNLVANDNNGVKDIFVRDRLENTTRRLSVASDGVEANAGSDAPEISGNGTVAVYRSEATNLVNEDTNNARDIFSHDLLSALTERLSVNSLGEEANAAAFTMPAITVDGRYVAFYSAANNLVANDFNVSWDVFVHDRTKHITNIVSVNNDGMAGDASSFEPGISANGHYVVYGSAASNLTPEDLNASWDIFLHVLVTANRAPIADAGADQSILLGETAQLDGTNSIDPDANGEAAGEVSQYQWRFASTPAGSNAVLLDADTATPRFVADFPGLYLVSLVVSDGEQDSIADEVSISVVENLDPTAVIDVQVLSGNIPLTVIFDASSSTDPEDGALTVHWDFGDSASEQNTSSEAIAQHTYTRPGNYTIVLTVTDPTGNTDKASVSIGVLASNNPPTVNPTATPVSGIAPLTVEFAANAADSENDSLMVHWDFGDGETSSQPNPSHIYTESGVYEAIVTVEDGEFSTQAAITIVVNPDMQIATKKAVIVLNNRHDDKDKLRFNADLQLDGTPGSADQVRFVLDDITLLDVPFSEFKPLGHDTGKYLYAGKHEIALLNLTKGTFKYSRHKAMLGRINHANGVSIQLSVGEHLATESIMMHEVNRHQRDEEHGDEDSDDDSSDDYDDHNGNHHHYDKDDSKSESKPEMQRKKIVLVYRRGGSRESDSHRSDADNAGSHNLGSHNLGSQNAE